MRLKTRLALPLLALIPGAGLACTMPPLIYFPPAEELEPDVAPALRYAASEYFSQMEAYTDCIKAELEEAGGDDAPELVKQALVTRNNVAVAEVDSVLSIVEETLEPLEEEWERLQSEGENGGAGGDAGEAGGDSGG